MIAFNKEFFNNHKIHLLQLLEKLIIIRLKQEFCKNIVKLIEKAILYNKQNRICFNLTILVEVLNLLGFRIYFE